LANGTPFGVSKMTKDTVATQGLHVEPLITLKLAADALGLPYFKVQRAARAGMIPTYTVYNSRRLVRLSEIVATIARTRQGGL
jgi:hypothetical protein